MDSNIFWVKDMVVFLHIRGINDEIIVSILRKVLSSLTILISIISAIYVFTYREQKTISPSNQITKKTNKYILLLVFSTIYFLIYGNMLVSEYKDLNFNSNNLNITKELFSKFITFDLLIVLYIIFFANTIVRMMNNISTDRILKDSIDYSNKLLNNISKHYRDEKFFTRIESISRYRNFKRVKYTLLNILKDERDPNVEEDFYNRLLNEINKFLDQNEKDYFEEKYSYLRISIDFRVYNFILKIKEEYSILGFQKLLNIEKVLVGFLENNIFKEYYLNLLEIENQLLNYSKVLEDEEEEEIKKYIDDFTDDFNKNSYKDFYLLSIEKIHFLSKEIIQHSIKRNNSICDKYIQKIEDFNQTCSFDENSLIKFLEDIKESINFKIDSKFKRVYLNYKDKKLLRNYKELNYSLEAVYQNFKFTAENNMNKEYTVNLNYFRRKIINLLLEKSNGSTVINYLYKNDNSEFWKLYMSILRSSFTVVTQLMKNQQYTKAEELIDLTFDLYIDDGSMLINIFNMNLSNYIDTIDPKDERQLSILLNNLKKVSIENSHLLYKHLLMRLINKEELKNLTNVIYAYKEHRESKRDREDAKLVIIMQCLIKSIEISNYSVSGFLVKFLRTNFGSKQITDMIKNESTILNAYKSTLEKTFLLEMRIEEIRENSIHSIKINEETKEYCFKKAIVLLMVQIIYSYNERLWFVKNFEGNGLELSIENLIAFLESQFSGKTDYKYIINKILMSKQKYGMISLDRGILEKIEKCI